MLVAFSGIPFVRFVVFFWNRITSVNMRMLLKPLLLIVRVLICWLDLFALTLRLWVNLGSLSFRIDLLM